MNAAVIREDSQCSWKSLLLASPDVYFRHLNERRKHIETRFTRIEHHREMVDLVFKSQKSETIADLLHALTTDDYSLEPVHTIIGICAGHIKYVGGMAIHTRSFGTSNPIVLRIPGASKSPSKYDGHLLIVDSMVLQCILLPNLLFAG